jgi:hypothetical protein
MASHALLEALQLVQPGTPLSRDPGQVSPGHAPTRSEVRTWAAVELDGHLDSTAHQVVLTPTCAPGHYYYLKVGGGVGQGLLRAGEEAILLVQGVFVGGSVMSAQREVFCVPAVPLSSLEGAKRSGQHMPPACRACQTST